MADKTEEQNISAIIRDFKKYTSKEIAKAIQKIAESRKEWLLNAMCKDNGSGYCIWAT